MGNFFTDTLQADPRFHSPDATKDMDLLEPGFRSQVETFMAASKAAGIELVVTETYRSSERQQQLYDQKLTQLRTVGVHHYGLAVDFVKKVGGYAEPWDFMPGIAARISTADRVVISGYDWGTPDQPHTFRDSDHIQGCTVAQQSGLFAGTWYPDDGTSVPPIEPVSATQTVQTAAAPSYPANLTEPQLSALTTFDVVNGESFNNWFRRSTFMAFCETESDFKPDAFRQEPSGVASYGLMQVLDSTAAGLGLIGDASQMYQPKIGVFYGLKYAAQGWNYLTTHFGRQPTREEWAAGYNEGYGAAAAGRPDPEYVNRFLQNFAKWQYLDTL